MNNQLVKISDIHTFISRYVKQLIEDESMVIPVEISLEIANMASIENISFGRWWNLLEKLQAATGQPGMGLRIGEFIKPEHLGFFGYLCKTCKDIKHLLTCFERFQRILYEGNQAKLDFEHYEGQLCGKLTWQADYGKSHQISDEVFTSGFINISNHLLGGKLILPVLIEFSNSVPQELESIYSNYFQCKVMFDQPNVSITFPSEYFNQSIVSSDENLNILLTEKAQCILDQTSEPEAPYNAVTRKTKSILKVLLLEGEPTAETIAKQMNTSTRNLHRQLNKEGVVFRELLRDTRKSLCHEYLLDEKISLQEIAVLLGYSEQSAFNRAFKSWFGQTPKQYKNLYDSPDDTNADIPTDRSGN